MTSVSSDPLAAGDCDTVLTARRFFMKPNSRSRISPDADLAAGSTLMLNNGTLLYTPGLITVAKAGPDTIKYSVTDTVLAW
jgi:hypothetical protein